MKRMYEMPMAYEEAFVANEYVSACITGIIPVMGERMGELINLTITMVIKVDIGLTHKENFMDYVVMMEISILELTVILED